MSVFDVYGPFEVPHVIYRKRRRVDTTSLRSFWLGTEGLGNQRGCYVYAFRSGAGYKPFYVGRATVNFRQECFTPHKLGHYNDALHGRPKARPWMFFVVLRSRRGKPNLTDIALAENFLIQAGLTRNQWLSNIKGTKQAGWSIQGVLRSKTGKPSSSAIDFRHLMGI